MSTLVPRQLDSDGLPSYNYDSSTCYDEGTCSWWWSDTGSAVRYTIVSILFFLLFLYFVVGYWHARRRARANLPPLAYHRWMVRRSSRPSYHYYNHPHGQPMYANGPQAQNPYYAQHPDSYGMQNSTFAPPPPAYQAGDAPPPVYQPPQGGSKVAANQNYEVRGEGSEVQAPGAAFRSA